MFCLKGVHGRSSHSRVHFWRYDADQVVAFCSPHASRTRSQARVKTLPTTLMKCPFLTLDLLIFFVFVFTFVSMQIGTGVTSIQSRSQFTGPNEQECHAARNNACYTQLLAGMIFWSFILLKIEFNGKHYCLFYLVVRHFGTDARTHVTA